MEKIVQFYIKLIITYMVLLFCLPAMGQKNRTYDGSNNNIQKPNYGAVGTNQLRVTIYGYTDGVSKPGGIGRPNPRHVSNILFNQDALLPDIMKLSDYAWAWGQFIDHEITLVNDDPKETCNISVPSGDPYFDPNRTGKVVIGMHRSAFDPKSGTSCENPREFPNAISSYIDASAVYGSDIEKANWLRTFKNGKLKASEGNLLPYNTVSGEYDSVIDPKAPEMAMPLPFLSKWFIAGDIRANENPLLTSIHTLFMREHNRKCDLYSAQNPTWTDEEIYQKVRKYIGGLMQAIIYEEWLPTLGVKLDPYTQYNDKLEVGIMNIFSAAAYRYGHTVINSTIIRMDNEGKIIPQGNILLRDAFFNPTVIPAVGGIAPYLKGMATQVEQGFDCKMIHDLRNFLFGAPGAGGLDLAAMNINRGRERGLPDYNNARADLGMPRLLSFASLTSNPLLNKTLEDTYGSIDNIDAWVGFLAEDHMPGALFGHSVMKIMERQFALLRDGDRFYYEIDGGLTPSEIGEIKNTRLYDIIIRNSGIKGIQKNVFVAGDHLIISAVDNASPLKFDVYPNPTTGQLFLNVGTTSSGSGFLTITDIYGQLVQSNIMKVNEGMNTINFDIASDLPKGIYIVSVKVGKVVAHKRIIKN